MDAPDKLTLTWKVHEALRREGFDLFGITPATAHPEDSQYIEEWIAAGKNGTMQFMERNLRKRGDITSLVEGARSVIVAGLRYFSDDPPAGDDNYFISRYARVRDYHQVMKEKLHRVLNVIQKEVPGVCSSVFCDSAPVTEKTWAVRAGLGWRGHNSLVINEEIGSFFFLGEIVTTAEFVYDNPTAHDHCGTCSRCIEACPTGAICDDSTIDARRCIAYLTIEHNGDLPEEFLGKTENMIFGCDRCQEVCPWNNKTAHYVNRDLYPEHPVTSITKAEWQAMTPEDFKMLFRSSPMKRAGHRKIKRNIDFVTVKSPEKR